MEIQIAPKGNGDSLEALAYLDDGDRFTKGALTDNG